ncbi:MAG TPA: hypothetical protein VME70_02445 [Mycobacteriales bacterium]|nr:hypothetical protein [Mycobacteriales bacterium]
MDALRRLAHAAQRHRYAVLFGWGAGAFVVAYLTRPKGVLTDWAFFEFSARTLIHLNAHYDTGALGLYAHNPQIQIGPPPIVLVAALQWLPPSVVDLLMTALMTLAGLWCLRCGEQIARRLHLVGGAEPTGFGANAASVVLLSGLVILPIWAAEAARWAHLDDVMAITGTLTAMAIIARGRRWWLAGLVLGIAIASKPWAIVAAPVVLGLPREDRARATLVAIITAGLCWAPFVIGDPQTVHALSSFQFPVVAGSTMHLLGMGLGDAPRWVRPVQFIGGIALSILAARQRRWMAIPLVGFGFRVVTDPQAWLYYGLGPIVGAMVWDASSGRRLPVWTGLTTIVEFGVPKVLPSWEGPIRLLWFLVVAVAVLRPNREPVPQLPDPALGSAAVAVPA